MESDKPNDMRDDCDCNRRSLRTAWSSDKTMQELCEPLLSPDVTEMLLSNVAVVVALEGDSWKRLTPLSQDQVLHFVVFRLGRNWPSDGSRSVRGNASSSALAESAEDGLFKGTSSASKDLLKGDAPARASDLCWL